MRYYTYNAIMPDFNSWGFDNPIKNYPDKFFARYRYRLSEDVKAGIRRNNRVSYRLDFSLYKGKSYLYNLAVAQRYYRRFS